MDIQLTEEQKDILKGKICPYCHIPSEYKSSVEVYGEDYGMIYFAPNAVRMLVFIEEPTKQKGDWQTSN